MNKIKEWLIDDDDGWINKLIIKLKEFVVCQEQKISVQSYFICGLKHNYYLIIICKAYTFPTNMCLQ